MRHGATCVLAAGLLLLTAQPAMASPASRQLVQEGLAEMQARRYEAALQKFEEAARVDPADARTVFFFQGAALNRLGRHDEALARLERAVQMGSPHPELAFELGWALLGVGRWRDAIVELERAEVRAPGRGQTSEFLGRAYLGRGDLARAEESFQEALRRDPRLAPTVRLGLASIAERRGDRAGIRAQAERLQQEAPDSPIARRLQEAAALVTAPTPAAAKPWQVVVSLSGGYNSNVIGLGDAIPLPADISQKHSFFGRATLGASYDWRLGARDSLTAGYGAQVDLYASIPEANFLDQVWYLDYRHAFTNDLAAAVRVSDTFSLLEGDPFRNQVAVRPAVGYRVTSWSLLELHYTLGYNDYYVDVPSVQDRDGLGHQVGLTWFAAIPGTRLLLRAGAFYGRYEAEGADFDFDSIGLFVGLNYPLFWQIVADVSYIHVFDRYDNPNSLAGPTGFGFKRDDDGDFVSVQLSRPILDWLSVYVRYDYSRNDSNVPFYEYDQHVVSSGVIARF